MSEDEELSLLSTPEEERERVAAALTGAKIPLKSGRRYVKALEDFKDFASQQRRGPPVTINLLYAYQEGLQETFSFDTVKTKMSMVRSMLAGQRDGWKVDQKSPWWSSIWDANTRFKETQKKAVKKAPAPEVSWVKGYLEDAEVTEEKRLVVALYVLCGSRVTEIANLMMGDAVIDAQGDLVVTLRVRKNSAVTEPPAIYRLPQAAEGPLAVHELLRRHLALREQLLQRQQEAARLKGQSLETVDRRLFFRMSDPVPGKPSAMSMQPRGTNWFADLIKEVVRHGHPNVTEEDIKQYTSHGFRRMAASMLADAGVQAHAIQNFLGHSSLSTSLEYVQRAAVVRSTATLATAMSGNAIPRSPLQRAADPPRGGLLPSSVPLYPPITSAPSNLSGVFSSNNIFVFHQPPPDSFWESFKYKEGETPDNEKGGVNKPQEDTDKRPEKPETEEGQSKSKKDNRMKKRRK